MTSPHGGPGVPMLRKLSQSIKEYIMTQLMYLFLLAVNKTLRVERFDLDSLMHYFNRGENVIFAFWHRRLFYLGYFFSRRFPGKKVFVLVSQSRDGTRIGKVINKMGLDYIQGSTTRGGMKAFKELVRGIRKKVSAGITPDGPKGPRGIVQQGVISLARITHRPIIPIVYHCSRYIEFKSWDSFVLPVPFSRVYVATGHPVIFDEKKHPDDSHYQEALQKELEALEKNFFRQKTP